MQYEVAKGDNLYHKIIVNFQHKTRKKAHPSIFEEQGTEICMLYFLTRTTYAAF